MEAAITSRDKWRPLIQVRRPGCFLFVHIWTVESKAGNTPEADGYRRRSLTGHWTERTKKAGCLTFRCDDVEPCTLCSIYSPSVSAVITGYIQLIAESHWFVHLSSAVALVDQINCRLVWLTQLLYPFNDPCAGTTPHCRPLLVSTKGKAHTILPVRYISDAHKHNSTKTIYVCCELWNSVFGHIARLPEDTPAHQALLCHVDLTLGRLPDQSWKRRPGRPNNRWIDQLRRDNNNATSWPLEKILYTCGHTGVTLRSSTTTRWRRRRRRRRYRNSMSVIPVVALQPGTTSTGLLRSV